MIRKVLAWALLGGALLAILIIAVIAPIRQYLYERKPRNGRRK